MHGSAGRDATQGRGAPATLASRPFPKRVKSLLQGVLDYAADELERGLVATLDGYELALLQSSNQAQSGAVRNNYLAARQEVARGRHQLLPRFRAELEASLATISDPPPAKAKAAPAGGSLSLTLSLVEDVVIEESITVNEIASRAEIRNNLPLFLLGQRLAVVAARPAFDAESLPIGPQRLAHCFQRAAECLDLNLEHRQQLLKEFDRRVLQPIGAFYEAVNQYLARNRVLPNLTFVPIRVRPTVQSPGRGAPASRPTEPSPTPAELGLETVAHEPRIAATSSPMRASTPPAVGKAELAAMAAQLAATPPPPQPTTRWPGQADPAAEAEAERDDADMFAVLRELMASRRSLVGKLGGKPRAPNAATDQVADRADVQRALSRLQAPRSANGNGKPGGIPQLKQDLLAELRQLSPVGNASALSDDDNDTIDLVALLFEHIGRELRPNSPARQMLSRLQVPLVRIALADKGFFTRREHPARQMLGMIADAGEFLANDDEADRGMLDRVRGVVERTGREFDGDPALLSSQLDELNQHLQSQARKSELAERRHVEAARGREKLEIARLHAAETLDRLLAGHRVPRFLRTLLGQAWSDVLALALLRGGEQSDTFRRQLAIAERLIEAAEVQRSTGTTPIGAEESERLAGEIGSALSQVGHHDADVQAITARLLTPDEVDEADPASSTELAMRLKQKVRFGQDAPAATADARALNDAEQAQLAAIKRLPFGTWFEFTLNQQGATERRRMSWFSPTTNHCLFLNHRGQRAGECSLPWLAREMVRGNVSLLLQPPGSLVDRAWGAIIRALHSFSGRNDGIPR
jgi:hypothetical protein